MATRLEEEEAKSGGLFPLFPTTAASTTVATAVSAASFATTPQWLSNSSFTADLSAVNAAVSSAQVEEDEDEDERREEAVQSRIYELIEKDKEKNEGSKKKKKKKEKRKSKRSKEEGAAALDDSYYYSKAAKDYYVDTRPDSDNLAYGSLYRMDVPSYKLCNREKVAAGFGFYRFYLPNRKSSAFDRESDVDALDGKSLTDGRYWSARYVAMDRHKSFKRVRLIAPREPVVMSSDNFIPLSDCTQISQDSDDGSPMSKSLVVEESWEDEVLNKTREFNKLTRECPHDEKAWLDFAAFQDKVASMQKQKGARLQTLEKKISILEKAAELNPENEELLLSLLKAYQSRDSADVLISRWEKVLMQHPTNYKMWREFLHVVQAEFSRFKVSEVRKMYSHAIRALSSGCSKRHRQVNISSEPPDPVVIQQELCLVDMFINLCRFEWQAGYQELATALFQAEIEFSIFCPSLLLTEQSKHRLFEHFWSSNGARVGEEGALGWSLWLEKEEQNRQKISREESAENNDEGGWTGWSEPLSIQKGVEVTSETTEDIDVAPESFEEEIDGNIKHEDDTEAMLKLLGIDVDAGASDEVKDASTWAKWSEEESSRDCSQWMPVRKAGGISSIDSSTDREVDDQFSRVVLYEDVNEYLFSVSSTEARLSLVYQFIDFFGGSISQWRSTNSSSWSEKINSLEALADSVLENLRKAYDVLTRTEGESSGFSLEYLLGNPSDISMRTEMMKFLRNAILVCLTAFPRNYLLEEAVLLAEELFVTNMKSHQLSTTPCQALAKRLLKSDRQNLLLCGVYARREAVFGNMNHARRVFDMALSSITGLPSDLQSNAPLLYLWYAESELSSTKGCSPEKEPAYRAMHILSCLGNGQIYSPFKCQPSSMQLLKAHQGFREKIKKIQSTWARGVIDDQSTALVCSGALFEELTNGLAAAVEILDQMFNAVLPGRRSRSHQLEFLFNYYLRMLKRHHEQLSFSKLWSSVSEGLQLYPFNPELYKTLIEICHPHTTSNKLRMMFDDYSRKNHSPVVWLFALLFEISRGGSQHRIRGLFERALENDTLRNSVILWRCYIAYEIEIVHNPSAARRIFFRAIHACPWSKKLWLDGFLKLNSVLSVKELSDLQEVMRDKELNLRTDIYEILLQDELVSQQAVVWDASETSSK